MNLIDMLAGENILNMEEVVKLPMLQALTYVQYKIEMNNLEKNRR